MISYEPLWKTMKQKGATEHTLRNKEQENGGYSISGSTVSRLKKGESVSTNTLDALCHILDCDLKDIIKFKK